ncbi:unnamed protein product, partial [marine sediment metagenome]
MSNLSMICSASSGKQIEGDAQLLPAIEKLLMIFRRYFPW